MLACHSDLSELVLPELSIFLKSSINHRLIHLVFSFSSVLHSDCVSPGSVFRCSRRLRMVEDGRLCDTGPVFA